MVTDVHDYQRRVENAWRLIERNERISEHNKRLIQGYRRDITAAGLGPAKLARRLFDLKTICIKWLPDGKHFEDARLDDIKEIVMRIETSAYAANTKRDFKVTLRLFYKWLRGTGEVPPEVAWFRTAVRRSQTKLPEDMLSEDDIRRLIAAEHRPRQRALIAVLYESGCRIGELLGLRWKHVAFDKYGARLLVQGKTGHRRVRILASVPYLAEWLHNHADRANPEAWVWTKFGSTRRVTYGILRQQIRQTAEKAGVRKQVNPHNFRHSRATALAKHLTEAQMKEYFGWVQASDMASIYVHLSGRDVDGALLQLYGIKEDKKDTGTQLLPKACANCQQVNGFANDRCRRCGVALEKRNEEAVAAPSGSATVYPAEIQMAAPPAGIHHLETR